MQLQVLKTYNIKLLLYLMILMPEVKCTIPGTFYWRPRLSIDLTVPSTENPALERTKNHRKHIYDGLIVLLDGYAAGLTFISFACGIAIGAGPMPHLNPFSAFFYTNAYRWGLRYLSALPHWIGGHGPNYVDTHKVWRRRFYYTDEFMPEWMKKLFPYVKKEEWDKEYRDWKKFKKYSESAFGPHFRQTKKVFDNFKSYIREVYDVPEVDYDLLSSESQDSG